MKKTLLIIICLSLLFQSGCQGDFYAIYRDVERLRPIQTLGLDTEGGRIVMSAAGRDPTGSTPFALCESGESMDEALVHLQNAFPEAEPYYAHVDYFLLGREAAAQNVLPWLEWFERNPQMRLDTTVFVVAGTAAQLNMSASGNRVGASERLQSLVHCLDTLGEGQAFTLRELAASLAERGAALCGVVMLQDQEGIVKSGDDSLGIMPAGFAVWKEDRVVEYISQEDVPGVLMFLGKATGARVSLDDPRAGQVVLHLDSARVKVREDKDGLVRLEAELAAAIAETEGTADPDPEELEALLAQQAADWAEDLLARQKRLNCDYLGLGLRQPPAETDYAFTVTVQVERSYDLRETEENL